VWNNEGVGGKDGLVQLGMLLAATERMTFGSAIANIWARPPQTAHGAAALLADAYPGRFVLGLGVGYPFQAARIGRDYGRPLATIRDYFEQMTAEQPLAQVPELSYPRILAANGPKMLALAAEIADGAMPILVPPEYTASARQVLGPDKILVVGLTAAVDEDEDRARAVARQYVSETVARPGSPYAVNLTRLGYAAEEISAPPTRWSTQSPHGATRSGSRRGSKSTWMQAPIMRGSPRSRLTSRLASTHWKGSLRC
jgi:probable F420-dependent oxidoreductase